MIFLGIDPGTARMGYSIVLYDKVPTLIESNVIETPADMEMPKRLRVLYRALNSIVKKHSPDSMIIERLFFASNVKTAMTVGQARGVSMLVAANNSLSVFEYTALEAKKIVTGYGRADKKDMQKAVQAFFKLKDIIKSDDANDAVAIALCHIGKFYAVKD